MAVTAFALFLLFFLHCPGVHQTRASCVGASCYPWKHFAVETLLGLFLYIDAYGGGAAAWTSWQ